MGMRWELAKGRIGEIRQESGAVAERFAPYFVSRAQWLWEVLCEGEDLEAGMYERSSLQELQERNHRIYAEVLPENYAQSFCSPSFACAQLGEDYGPLLGALAFELRGIVAPLFAGQRERVLIRLELFLEVYSSFSMAFATGGGVPEAEQIRQILVQYLGDYARDEQLEATAAQMVREDSLAGRVVREGNLSDPRYLYRLGEYISADELGVWRLLDSLPQEEINRMADTWAEGYRRGFAVTGKDLSKKRQVSLTYPVGFERVVRRAAEDFAAMGLVCTFPREEHTLFRAYRSSRGGWGTDGLNPQFYYDHREDLGLFLDAALRGRRVEALQAAYSELDGQTQKYGGPAVMDAFGQEPFAPVADPHAVQMSEHQNHLQTQYRAKALELYDRAVIGSERSFTIIAFPLPGIAGDEEEYRQIFSEIVRINTLDSKQYERIQSVLIDALDQADHVHVVGRGENRTDLCVKLWTLGDPAHETIFENCVADVNIPVGEVFTTPVLEGTNGVLHVTRVYLEGLLFTDLSLTFRDGRVVDYSCGGFSDPQEGRRYIEENILYHHENLPMGECAIGTNTTAYAAAERFGIAAKLPILIAEKTGPHFAVGDTCYSHEEDNRTYNPDGKEIVARENACSALRHTDPEHAYFGCHTDITIPYGELGSYAAVLPDGREVEIIRDGRFVLPGTGELNAPLDELGV